MKVLIISGGYSSERKISLISAKEVKAALEANKHLVKLFDLKKGYPILKNLLSKFDVIFPVLHGEEGEGGELQKLLSKLGKPYVGGSPDGFKEGWFKIPFKKFCDKNNFPTAPWKVVNSEDSIIKFGFPCVLKASSGGSSKEVVILKSKSDLRKTAVKNLFKDKTSLMIEQFLPGIEVTVGILNNQALPVFEIIPPEGKWFDFQNKYSGKTQEVPNAPSLNTKLRKQVQDIALKIHQVLDLGPYSRIDFIVSGNTPNVLEVNTIPGLTPQSLFPKAALAAGLSFEELIEKLINPLS